MGYYGSGRGDYYKGDYYGYRAGGLFGFLGKAIGSVARVASILPGPLGAAAGLVSKVVNPRQGTALAPAAPGMAVAPVSRQVALPQLPPIGVGQVGPFGSQQGALIQVQSYTAGGRPKVDTVDSRTGRVVGGRKRMNVANPRALRRALRRVAGFGKLAKRAKRDIARAASAIGVRRGGGGGSRGVITRSEAARALRR